MYNESKLRQAFWTNFGQYMQPVLSADGEKIGWLNYKTGVRHLFFKMDAGRDFAVIGIYLRNPDQDVRLQQFNQFSELKNILEDETGEEWKWEPEATDEYGKMYARIYLEISGVNINETTDWPKIISFFKPRIMALDRFWSVAKEVFTG